MPRLLLVDGHAFAYRAFHALRSLSGPDGRLPVFDQATTYRLFWGHNVTLHGPLELSNMIHIVVVAPKVEERRSWELLKETAEQYASAHEPFSVDRRLKVLNQIVRDDAQSRFATVAREHAETLTRASLRGDVLGDPIGVPPKPRDQQIAAAEAEQARAALARGEKAPAEEHWRNVTKHAPASTEAWESLGDLAAEDQLMLLAEYRYRLAIRFAPDNKQAAAKLKRVVDTTTTAASSRPSQ